MGVECEMYICGELDRKGTAVEHAVVARRRFWPKFGKDEGWWIVRLMLV